MTRLSGFRSDTIPDAQYYKHVGNALLNVEVHAFSSAEDNEKKP